MAPHFNLRKVIPPLTTANPQGPTPPVVAAPIGAQRILTGDARPWVPQRLLVPLGPVTVNNRLAHIFKTITPKTSSGKPVIAGKLTGAPQAVFNVSAAQSPLKVQAKTVSQITVTFARNFSDSAYDHVAIWVKGYQGNSNWVEYASSTDSPANFFLEATGESVQVAVQAVSASNQSAAPIPFSPSVTVTLSGVVSNPPAPTITQTLVAIPLGYQFTFTQVQLAAGTEDVLKSYKIYRNSSNTFAGATVIQTIPDDGKNDGAPVVVQDQQAGGSVFYYWVTAVNTAGLESSASSAQAGLINSGLVDSRSSIQVNQTVTSTATSPILTQSGTTTTINVAAFTAQFGFGQVGYNSGSVNPGVYGTFIIYFSDPNYAGGAVTYLSTTHGYVSIAADGLQVIGSITTSAGGGGSGGSTGGNPVTCFSGNTRLQNGVPISETKVGDLQLTARGTLRPVTAISKTKYSGPMLDMGSGELVTPGHLFRGLTSWMRVADLYPDFPSVQFDGEIWNLEIEADENDFPMSLITEHSYTLANGFVVHNVLTNNPP